MTCFDSVTVSKNGTAKGHLIYAGRGTKAEFDSLVLQGTFTFLSHILENITLYLHPSPVQASISPIP